MIRGGGFLDRFGVLRQQPNGIDAHPAGEGGGFLLLGLLLLVMVIVPD